MNIFWSIILSILGIIAGVIVTWRFTKTKKPIWYFKMNQLFHRNVSKIDVLNITYNNSVINNLSSIYLAFWNNGKETITNEMIAETILFYTNSNKIYDAHIVSSSAESNEFDVMVSDDGSSVELKFKYLDYKQGAVVQIFSDCENVDDFEMQGAIMGCKKFSTKINNSRFHKWFKRFGWASQFFFILGMLLSATITLMIYFIDNNSEIKSKMIETDNWINLYIILIFSCSATTVLSILVSYGYFSNSKRKIPKEMKKYLQSENSNL